VSTNADFPSDDNGHVLQQMYDGGDDLTQPRVINFNFVFPDRKQALAFVDEVADQTVEACLSWYQRKSLWQVIVKRKMVPDHAGITAMESSLTLKAVNVGGSADGWGCFKVPRRAS
jgi:hypothetical protein